MTTLRAEAPAKINLDLRVLAREMGGYHQIETLFLQVDFCDRLTITTAESDISLEVSGEDLGPHPENLVYRAAQAFLEAAGVKSGVHIELDKRIPSGSGLGGGSSDAAMTLRILNSLFDGPLSTPDLLEIAGKLGSDVPFFLTESGFALGWGRGGRLLELNPPPVRYVVIALPGIHVSTAVAYESLMEVGTQAGAPRAIAQSELSVWEHLEVSGANDFEVSVFRSHPVLSQIREELETQGAGLARMSGSGSAIFGVFADSNRAEVAVDRVKEVFGCDCVLVPTRQRWTDIDVPEG